MRRLALLLTISLLAIQPASAKEDSLKGVPVFGSKYCKPTFACPNAVARERQGDMTRQIIDISNKCTRTYLGVKTPGSNFEEVLGLDASQCLTPRKVKPDAYGIMMIPKCCVHPIDSTNKTCQVTCTLYGVK